MNTSNLDCPQQARNESAKPIISLVVPANNREDLILETLISIQNQTFTDFECLVIDDHSTDHTVEVCQNFAAQDDRFKIHALPDGKRYANAGRNYGMSLACGDFINFVDSDDLLLPEKLSRQMEIFSQHPELDMVCCQGDALTENGLEPIVHAPPETWLDVIWYQSSHRKQGILWQTNAPLWRKAVLEKIGGWNETVLLWDDPELNLRALLNSVKILRIEEVLYHLRRTDYKRISIQQLDKRITRLIDGIVTGYSELIQAGQATPERKALIRVRTLNEIKLFAQSGERKIAFSLWRDYSRKLDTPFSTWLQGAILLLPQIPFAPLKNRVADHFYRPLFLLEEGRLADLHRNS